MIVIPPGGKKGLEKGHGGSRLLTELFFELNGSYTGAYFIGIYYAINCLCLKHFLFYIFI
jgi:hypothetical protein